jgi:hypothetical protein
VHACVQDAPSEQPLLNSPPLRQGSSLLQRMSLRRSVSPASAGASFSSTDSSKLAGRPRQVSMPVCCGHPLHA